MVPFGPDGSERIARDIAETDFDEPDRSAKEDHAAHATGEACGRCGQVIEARQSVRRRASGDWVHENCPS